MTQPDIGAIPEPPAGLIAELASGNCILFAGTGVGVAAATELPKRALLDQIESNAEFSAASRALAWWHYDREIEKLDSQRRRRSRQVEAGEDRRVI